jgi:endonuclease YncB( thermonuclease family)
MKVNFTKVFLFFFLWSLFSCTTSGSLRKNPVTDDVVTVMVESVQDGDTFRIRIGERDSIGVRILGGDVYESRRGTRLEKQAAKAGISETAALMRGLAAKERAKRLLLSGVEIRRVSGEPNIDVYGRLLRQVFIGGRNYFLLLPDSVKVP